MATKRNWRDELADMIQAAAKSATYEAMEAGQAGDFREMVLYYRDATKHGTGCLLVTRKEDVPAEFEDAGQRLPCNVPYDQYYRWIESRVGRLPILTVA